MQKSRLSKENKQIQCLLTYDKGLDRYYGLVDLALNAKVWGKIGNRIDIDGTKLYEKAIYKEPKKYFTAVVLDKIEEYVRREFTYGTFEPELDDDSLVPIDIDAE